MKAPEKLYLRKRNKLPLEVVRYEWYKTDPQSLYGSVEYLRTDAFIEKADKFISSFFHPDDTELKKSILDEFHKYMKGE